MSAQQKRTYPLDGFNFDSEKERHSSAEFQYLWPYFEAWYRKKWNPNKPDMSQSEDSMLWTVFCRGAEAEEDYKKDKV